MNIELNKIYNEDCLKFMKTLPDNCVDSIVTDPPYGLSSHPNISEVMQCWLKGEQYKHNAKGFMGKEWDSFIPGPEYWKEAYRILKPGGHLAAFAGSRTQDLMSIAIRFGGFEIKDTLFWLYSSGFPKSSNISLNIDRKLGYEPKIVGYKQSNIGSGDSFAMRQTEGSNSEIEHLAPVYEFNSDQAKKWEGCGTALKPAYEPIILAKKPNEKGLSTAENVLKWGTGGLNIKKCRVGTEKRWNSAAQSSLESFNASPKSGIDYKGSEVEGRWPSNILIDGSEQIEGMFYEFGETESSKKSGTRSSGQNGMFLSNGGNFETQAYGDSGTMTRMLAKLDYDEEDYQLMFYVSGKATIADRDEGLDKFELKQKAGEYCISAHNGENRLEKSIKRKNIHPTVKPTKLMMWLCKLITPAGGLIYDPFSGSGSTGKGAIIEGYNFIGTEMECEYSEIANVRVQYAKKFKDILKQNNGNPLIKNKTKNNPKLTNENFF